MNSFEIFVRRDGAQGALEKRGVSGLFKVSALSWVEWDSVVWADPDRRRRLQCSVVSPRSLIEPKTLFSLGVVRLNKGKRQDGPG